MRGVRYIGHQSRCQSGIQSLEIDQCRCLPECQSGLDNPQGFAVQPRTFTVPSIPETARWGTAAEAPYTPDSFQTYVDWIVDVNAESRTDIVIGQYMF